MARIHVNLHQFASLTMASPGNETSWCFVFLTSLRTQHPHPLLQDKEHASTTILRCRAIIIQAALHVHITSTPEFMKHRGP